MVERGRRAVEDREDPLTEVDHLWIPPEFKRRMKSLGMTVRWIRYTEDYIRQDRRLQSRFQQGWEFVKPDEIPEWKNPPVQEFGKNPSLIVVGDLALAICPKKNTDKIQKASEQRAADLKQAVKNNFREAANKPLNKYTPVFDEGREQVTTGGRATKFGD